MENPKSETAYINKYQKLGYTSNYRAKEAILIDVETKKEYHPKDITVDEEFRFEGASNPSDMSILYVITTNDNSKGTVLANYSPANVSDLAAFFAEIPKANFK
ncbi:MAG: hypothetical protein NWQ38_16610, partial [Cellulophaga sp.]|nr:hypothetical protein [Cellulophaga sp.]